MITRINASIPVNTNYYNNKHISFKGYSTMSEDINIYSKGIDSPIKSMSGDIDIEDSKVKSKISNMSGDISVSSSKIEGDISNLSGDIKIRETSAIYGNISNQRGTIVLSKSSLNGDASNLNGKVVVRNSIVDGAITSKPENLQLEGKNGIKELILTGVKKAPVKDANQIKAELAKQGIFINGNIGQINYGEKIVNVFSNGKLKSTSIINEERPFEFRLPAGSVINTIKFDGDKQGVLILEKGAEFFGKLINGIIRRI